MKATKICLLISIVLNFNSYSQELIEKSEKEKLLEARIPTWVIPVLDKVHFSDTYYISDTINPFYLESDFTGDNVDDIVLFIINKQNSKSGIVIINGKTNISFIYGAGKDFGMGDNMSWVKIWNVCRDKSITSLKDGKVEMNFKNPVIKVVRNESIAAYFYWTGKKYKTYNQAL